MAQARKARMEQTLLRAFHPTDLEVIDESDRHKGHAGWRLEGETHYHIHMTAEAFSNKTRVESHRLVYEALAQEFDSGLHALRMSLFGAKKAKND